MRLVAGRDPLCRFYTLPHIGDLLVNLMPYRRAPRRVIDLGAGAGTLSQSATRRWAGAEIVTIDVDGTCVGGLSERLRSERRRHVHHTIDALDPDLPQIIATGGAIEAAVCNPPYVRPHWRPGFERVLEEAGLLEAFGSPHDVTAESLFLAQAVRLTADGGNVGLIVPDGIVTGVKTCGLRRALLERHRINAVVQLPRSSFKDAEVQAFLLIFRNRTKPGKLIKLVRYDNDAGLSEPIAIERAQAEHRMDYEFHASGRGNDQQSLGDIGAVVTRGTISATVARAQGIQVFHTTDFPHTSCGTLSFGATAPGRQSENDRVVTASEGDILLARVHRNLHRKVAMVVYGSTAISDCVYRIRVPACLRKSVFTALRSEAGERRIYGAARGVGARQLAKQELLDLPILPRRKR